MIEIRAVDSKFVQSSFKINSKFVQHRDSWQVVYWLDSAFADSVDHFLLSLRFVEIIWLFLLFKRDRLCKWFSQSDVTQGGSHTMEFKLPVIQTPQDLEQAIQLYRSGDWNGNALFALWQAIRNSALAQANDAGKDVVPGEDSY
jgi:hypothetical protein